MGNKKRVRSNEAPRGVVADILGHAGSRNGHIVFDFSIPSAWRACEKGGFTSFFTNEAEFVEKFRVVMKVVQELSQRTPSEVFNQRGYEHCHAIKGDNLTKIQSILADGLDVSEQIFVGETLMQVGLDRGVRIVGFLDGNIFVVCMIDYHHRLYFDERRNTIGKESRRFCPIGGEQH